MLSTRKIILTHYRKLNTINYLVWLAEKSEIFISRDDNVLWFFKKFGLSFYSYFKKNKSVFRNSQSEPKLLFRALTSKGNLEKQRITFFKIYYATRPELNNPVLSSRSHILKIYSRVNLEFDHTELYAFFNLFFSLPVFFKFSFHLINKKIRKFSRGKSGKYKCVYNYLPFFKREKFKTKQFKKNLKTIEGKEYSLKIYKLIRLYRYKFSRTTIFYERERALRKIFFRQYNSIMLKSH